MIPTNVKQIMQTLLDNNFEAYIIGGAVRDSFFFTEPHDWDIFTNATGEEILKLFPKGVVLGGEERQKKILTVIVDGVEVSQYRLNGDRTETGKKLEDHQWTCDFYLNALAIDINSKLCGDLTIIRCGQEDIKNKLIRFVGHPQDRINEDPLRILRAVRFSLKYDVKLQNETHDAILANSDKILNLPPERIRDEFLKLLQFENSIKLLHELRLLKLIIPELFHNNHFNNGGKHHNETPFNHMFNSFKESCKITDNVLLRLTCLLHDIGKGETFSCVPSAECNDSEKCGHYKNLKSCAGCNNQGTCNLSDTHFYEHDVIGCDIARELLTRLKFSNDNIAYISNMIRLHMFGYHANITKKAYVRFFGKLNKHKIPIIDYVMMIYCDHQGNMAKPRIKFGDFVGGNFLLKHYWECTYDNNTPFTVKDLEVDGKDILALGVKPGPMVGKILIKIYKDVLDGLTPNKRPILLSAIKQHLQEVEE